MGSFWAATRKPSLPLALLAGLLVSYHLYLYDLTLLLLPISLIFNRNIDSPHPRREKAALYASLFFVLASLWGTAIPFNFHYLAAIPLAILFASLSASTPTAVRVAPGSAIKKTQRQISHP